MKIIKEDIENLERFVGNRKVDVHAELPLIIADAYNSSKESQEEIEKEMEEHNKETEVKLNKVLGAENQPVPDLPETPKAALDESLFEDYEELSNTSVLKEDLQDERVKNIKKCLLDALVAVDAYLNHTTNESLENGKTDSDEAYILDKVFTYLRELKGDDEFTKFALNYLEMTPEQLDTFCDIQLDESLEDDCDYDFFIKKHKGINKNFDREKYGKYFDKDGKLIPGFQKEYFSLKKTEALEDDDFETDLTIDFEPADFDDYAVQDIVGVGQSLKDVVRYQTNDDADYFVLTFKDGTKKAWFIHGGMYIPDKDFKECLEEARKKEERDLFTQIMDDLSATNYNMKDKSKFPDMKLSDKYEDEYLGIDYPKDGFVDITVRQPSKEKLDFAKKVANAYEAEVIGPNKEGENFILKIRIPE